MAFFKRKKTESVLPEVDEYYQAERRDRTWLAWVLAIISIIIVVLFLIGIFFLGRWVYDSLTDNNSDTETVSVTDSNSEDIPSFDGASEGTTSDESTDDSSTDSTADEADSDDSEEGTVDAPAQTTTPSDSSSDSNLPDTGPADTIKLFALVSIIAGFGHHLVTRLKSSRN